MTTRKNLYLIVDAPDDEEVGNVEFTDRRHDGVTKNERGTVTVRDLEAEDPDAVREYEMVGMGYYDFEDEDDYAANMQSVARDKLDDIDDEHLDAAGLAALQE